MRAFVIGTDTGVGKTYVTTHLLKTLPESIGLKPVSSGKIFYQNQFINEDALLIQKGSSQRLSLEQINPLSFDDPIAPHITAEKSGKSISVLELVKHIKNIEKTIPHRNLIIEGAGGLMVPYNDQESQVTLIQALKIPVLLVVGLKLGCLNHAALTLKVLQFFNLKIIGWVANHVMPDMSHAQENLTYLRKIFHHIPCWGVYPFKRVASPDE